MNPSESTPSSSNISSSSVQEDVISNFKDIVNDYVSTKKPHLYILTPCYGGMCFINYVHCLMTTLQLMRDTNISVTVEFCRNDSLVPRARNNLIAKAMACPTMTHIMFIDNDITWDPVDILKLMIADKYVVGGIYPLKKYDFNKLVPSVDNINPALRWIQNKNNTQLKNIVSDEQTIQHQLLRYNTNFLGNQIEINKNLTKVRHLATGFMMLKRETIEQMSKAFPQTKYTDDISFLAPLEQKYAYALFDCAVVDDHYLSEDWLFCDRWSKMGGNIYIDVSISLSHTGIEDYNGSLLTTLLK